MSALVLCDDSNGRALIDRAIEYGIKGPELSGFDVYATECLGCHLCGIDPICECPQCGYDMAQMAVRLAARMPIACPGCGSVLFICGRPFTGLPIITAFIPASSIPDAECEDII